MTTDVFVSHASEDKNEVARPLAEELTRRGFRVWYDEYSLRVGDSLREKIDEGLSTCTFGLVVISPSSMVKPWPNREVNGLVALETGDGRKRILPVWHNTSAEEVAQWSPTIADLKATTTDRGLEVVADEIAWVLRTVCRERLVEELRGLLRADRQIRAVYRRTRRSPVRRPRRRLGGVEHLASAVGRAPAVPAEDDAGARWGQRSP